MIFENNHGITGRADKLCAMLEIFLVIIILSLQKHICVSLKSSDFQLDSALRPSGL